MQYYTVEEIAERRNVSKQAIYKQLKTHKDKLEGHFIKEKGKIWYDEDAVKILDDASNQSAPVIVEMEDKEEVERLKKRIAELESELDADRIAMREFQATINDILKNSAENAKLAADAKLYIEQKDSIQKDLDNANAEIDRLKNRSLMDRILNK